MKYTLFVILLPVLLFITVPLVACDYIVKADSLFELRDRDFNEEKLLADSARINRAIALYKTAINDSICAEYKKDAIWKLLQALYFKGNFTTHNKSEKKEIFTEGIEIGEKYKDEFPQSVEVHCWLGIIWGYWGEVHSALSAARKGVPKKVKYYAKKTIELDDKYLDAGGYRMLGRLHFMVPKIPLLLSWPSKEKSQQFLEQAYQIAPDNLLNKLYLAEVLFSRDYKDRAFDLLHEIVDMNCIKHGLVVDAWIKKQADEFLKKNFSESE